MPKDLLADHERSGLTIWGTDMSAQMQRLSTLEGKKFTRLALNVGKLGEHLMSLSFDNEVDICKIRDLLNEATKRGYLTK